MIIYRSRGCIPCHRAPAIDGRDPHRMYGNLYEFVVLFTDLTNSPSNDVDQAICYHPLSTVDVIEITQ